MNTLSRSNRPDPYEECPTYESQTFLIRLISMDDAEDLVKCYNNTESQRFFNYDPSCINDYFVDFSLEKMKYMIFGWLNKDYKKRFFVRFSIIDIRINKVVGTLEMFPLDERGILRIDILPEYEKSSYIKELLKISDNFTNDFNCERIITKAIPEATERIRALLEYGYEPYPKSGNWYREHYFVKL